MKKFNILFILVFPIIASSQSIVISEVLFNPLGVPDDQHEWVELHNTTGLDIDISNYSIAWGIDCYGGRGYYNLPAATLIPANGFLVFGGPNSVVENGEPCFVVNEDFNPDITNQDPGGAPNAIGFGLFDFPANPNSPFCGGFLGQTPVHQVLYNGTFNLNDLLDQNGNSATIDFANVVEGNSLVYNSITQTWSQSSSLTPEGLDNDSDGICAIVDCDDDEPLLGLICCPTSDILLDTQQKIDDFGIEYAGCATIFENLKIEESITGDITNLNGLNQVETILGNLNIQSNTALTDFSGLDNLNSIGGQFWIYDNDNLTTLDGLSGLESVGSHLNIVGNLHLEELNAISNLTSINGGLQISDNDQLYSLEGIENIEGSGLTILIVQLSANLAVCAFPNICDYLNGGGLYTIHTNAFGCNDFIEIHNECNGCPDMVTVNFDLLDGEVIKASNVVKTKQNQDIIVENGKSVYFKAGSHIRLRNGFGVEQGAEFESTIEDCSNN